MGKLISFCIVMLCGLICPSYTAVMDCPENGQECKEFLKANVCGRHVWCYKRIPVDNINNICTFSDTKYSIFTLKSEGPPVPNPNKCKIVTDANDVCVKSCLQQKNRVYPFLGFINVCIQQSITYICTANTGQQYCGCAQLANGDTLKGKELQPGDKC